LLLPFIFFFFFFCPPSFSPALLIFHVDFRDFSLVIHYIHTSSFDISYLFASESEPIV